MTRDDRGRAKLAWLLAIGGLISAGLPTSRAGDEDPRFFAEQVEPLLRRHCHECHSHAAGKTKGGLTLDSRGGWAHGGDHGPAIEPGHPDASLLIQAVRRIDPDRAMPPKSPLPPDAVEKLVEWVRRGAFDPRVPPAPPSATNGWWAIAPLVRPALPIHAGAMHPIDAFVLAHQAKPAPSPPAEADRRVLLRRLMVDLHGLLPTPEEVAAFERDPAPGAFDEEVERLLASPRYGERWARHWLDVAHFAETHGHDQDRPRENAWPFRDYLIESFNDDKPYSRFVQEQVAADTVFPDQPALLPALGFLAAGPWDESSLRDIREDTVDREIGRYLDRDDMVANVMSTFASVTVHCARCHDHKFDPITQRDYYALQAVFAGTEKAERLYDRDPAANSRRQYWMRLQVALDRRDRELVERLLSPSLRQEMEVEEVEAATLAVAWVPLRQVTFATSQGTELKLQSDGSLLATGPSPAIETYTVTGRIDDGPVTAVRLEVMADDSLPQKGPGRATNGNLHLTELKVSVASEVSAVASARGEDGATTVRDAAQTGPSVALRNPSADFEQESWTVAHAMDGNPQTAWGIHPQEGRSHVAVFEFAAPIQLDAGQALRFVLEQEHGRQHTIGKFRLSVTSQAPPVRANSFPAAVALALRQPRHTRTEADQFEVTSYFLRARVAREIAGMPAPQRVYAGAQIFPDNAGQKSIGRTRPVRVLRRGEISQPLEEATPGALSCVAGLSARFAADNDEGARRAALARWLTDPQNPLTWRTIVNRVWYLHFGRGLVETPNDFGRMGGTPSDPALLDWLAVTFRDDLGGSLKRLHALILTSRAWRQPSAAPGSADAFQPLRRRLDAETFRDSVLRISGRLDLAMGGPSVRQFALSEGIHVTPNIDYSAYDVDSAGNQRRSIYRFLFRTLPDPLMDSLDSPSGDQSVPIRSESFTALQAFALLHHPFLIRQSEHLATRVRSLSTEPKDQVRIAYELAFQHEPSPALLAGLTQHASAHGLEEVCRVLFNSNEFHFID